MLLFVPVMFFIGFFSPRPIQDPVLDQACLHLVVLSLWVLSIWKSSLTFFFFFSLNLNMVMSCWFFCSISLIFILSNSSLWLESGYKILAELPKTWWCIFMLGATWCILSPLVRLFPRFLYLNYLLQRWETWLLLSCVYLLPAQV